MARTLFPILIGDKAPVLKQKAGKHSSPVVANKSLNPILYIKLYSYFEKLTDYIYKELSPFHFMPPEESYKVPHIQNILASRVSRLGLII